VEIEGRETRRLDRHKKLSIRGRPPRPGSASRERDRTRKGEAREKRQIREGELARGAVS